MIYFSPLRAKKREYGPVVLPGSNPGAVCGRGDVQRLLRTKEKLTELAKREGKGIQVCLQEENELTDRVIKLAEVGRPRSNRDLQAFWDPLLLYSDFWWENSLP